MTAFSKYAIQLTGEERFARLQEVLLFERMALEESTRQGLESAKRCYTNICYSLGLTPFPVSVESLAAYFIHFVKYLHHTARSIPTLQSHITRANRMAGHDWLSKSDEARLRDIVTGLICDMIY